MAVLPLRASGQVLPTHIAVLLTALLLSKNNNNNNNLKIPKVLFRIQHANRI